MRLLKLGGQNPPEAMCVLVEALQHRAFLDVNGRPFSEATIFAAVKKFQASRGLVADGIVGNRTWDELNRQTPDDFVVPPKHDVAIPDSVDTEWIHAFESHEGKPYWPGGLSGVTLDPGFDLGAQKQSTLRSNYTGILSVAELEACSAVLGLRGVPARNALRGVGIPRDVFQVLSKIRITEAEAVAALPRLLLPYYTGMTVRWPLLLSSPAQVQTGVLSLVYNRGVKNRALEVLSDPIARADWAKVGNLVGAMQQDHPLRGIRTRRRAEGRMILSAVG